MLSHIKHATKPRVVSFTRHFVQPHITEENKMKQRIENLFYLCTGIALFFALNQHLIGHGVSYTCAAIETHRNNFVFELAVLFTTALTLFDMAILNWTHKLKYL